MEAFSLLKYWRASSSSPSLPPGAPLPPSPDALTTTVPAAADSTSDDNSDDGDDGPFFDLEFTVPDDTEDDTPDNLNANHTLNEEEEQEDDDDDVCSDGEEEGEFKFTLSPSTNEAGDPNLSPSEDLFFKGKLVKVEPLITSSDSEPNNSKPPPQFTASLLKSATKFRVFMSTLKKNKPSVSDKDSNSSSDASKQTENPPTESQKKPQENQQQKKLFTVKFKIEEVPIMSLFTRDNSSKGTLTSKTQKQNMTEDSSHSHSQQSLSSSSSSDEKRFSKEVMQKYLKMVKPLYIKVSKRYGGKLKFSGQLNVTSRVKLSRPKAALPVAAADTAAVKNSPAKPVAEKVVPEGDGSEVKGNQKQGNIPAGLKVVCKHLGKSRSASAAVAAAPAGSVSSRRRDDSLLQQQDGIQGAILHCKRSFNAPREGESSQLPRSVSDPLHETSSSPELSRKSLEKGKDKTCP